MADDAFHTVTAVWEPVQISAADITDGVYTVYSHTDKRVEFWKKASAPTASQENGVTFLKFQQDSIKFELTATDNLYARCSSGTVRIGVIPA